MGRQRYPGWAGGGARPGQRVRLDAGFLASVLPNRPVVGRGVGNLHSRAIDLEPNGKLVLRMSVLTHPQVTASFGQESHTVAEGATQSVTVTLSADPERTVTIPIVTMGQDGATDVDYSGVPDSVTFNAGGPTEMTFTFTATQDTVDDEGESVLLGFGPDLSGGVRAGTPDETTLTITDDDPPEVSFGQSAYTVAEGGMVSVEVKLTSAPASAVTVPVTHTPQGATSSADYSGVPSSVTFSAGETSKTFSFTATQDTVDDDGESVLLTFGTLPATVQTGTTTETTVTITDDDAAEVSFGQSAYTVAEGGMVSVEVKLTSAPASAVTVPVTHTPQGATSSADYSGVPSSVTFSAGETSKTFSFTATQDTVDDDGESVLLTFGTLPATVQTGTTTETTVTITDDDAAEVSFGQSAYTVAEGGMVSVEVKLTSAPASAVTVPVTHTPQGATSSADYSGVPSSVTFSAGETSKTFSFTATQDTVDDDGESVLLTFGTLPATVQTGTTTETTVTITDDDAAAGKVALELTPATINESGTGNASTVTASIPSASSAATTVTVSVSPADTTTLTGNRTLTISAGDTNSTGVVTITAVNDDAVTGNRTVAVSGTAVNSVGVTDPDDATLTIREDDAAVGKVTLELTPATISESGTGNASTVTASVPSASSAATTVTVSVNPADTTTLTGNTTLTIPAGDTNSTGVVTITAVNDDAVTGNRTVAVSGTAVNSVGVTDPDHPGGGHEPADDQGRRRGGGEGDPGADAGDDQRERDGKCEHGYGERTVGVQRGHDGHGVGEPGGHHDADREHDPDHPGGGHEQHGGGDHHGGERRRGDREPDGGGERDGGEQRGGNRPGRRDADDQGRRRGGGLRERRHWVCHREVCR